VLGSALGALLPFVVTAWFRSGRVTDPYFLAVGTTLFVTAIFAVALEAIFVPFAVEYRQLGQDAFRRGLASVALQGATLAVVVAGFAAMVTSLWILPHTSMDHAQISSVVRLLLLLLPLPSLVTVSALLSAVHNANGWFGRAAISQVARPGGALLVGFAFRGAFGVSAVAVGLCLGELCRLCFLGWGTRRLIAQTPTRDQAGRAPKASAFWRVASPQVGSMVIAGLAPITDKIVSATFGTGSVTLIELSEKLFYTPMTLLSSGLAVVCGTAWAALAQDGSKQGMERLRSDYIRSQRLLALAGASVSVVCIAATWILRGWAARTLGLQNPHEFAITFTMFAAGLPFSLCVVLGTRLLSVCKRTKVLPVFAVLFCATNLLLDILLGRIFGIAGVALSSTVVRALSCALFVFAARSLFASKTESQRLEQCDTAHS
ncbi:MAG: lipid II flippase MurJ, partial [bacterium]